MKTFLSSKQQKTLSKMSRTSIKKIETPYVQPTIRDVQTIENETKNEIDEFLLAASGFNKIDIAATKQKKVDFYNKLFDDLQDVTDYRQVINDTLKTEDLFIDDEFFSNTDKKDIRNLVNITTMGTDINDILFDHEPVDVTPNVPLATGQTLDFSDVLSPKNKGKNKAAKRI